MRDPVLALGPVHAWKATDVVTSGGQTTSWNARVAGSAALTVVGAANPAPVNDSLLNNRPAVPIVNAGGPLAGYGCTITPPGNSQTLFVVGRVVGAYNNILAVCNGGASNTGSLLFTYADLFYGRTNLAEGGDVTISKASPYAFIAVGTFTLTSKALRLNSTTVGSGSGGTTSSFSYGTVGLGSYGGSGSYLNGAIAEAAIFNRVLTSTEISNLMTDRAAHYGITLS